MAKNLYAINILKRIKSKLQGKDEHFSPNKVTVEQQVSWVVQEATSVNNLCVLYEGWTPWI